MARFCKSMCPRYQAAVDIVGKRWTGMILYALMSGPLRFNELTERLEVVSDRMVSERLKELESEGIVERRVQPEPPVRVEYRLTEKGLALSSVIEAIGKWAELWIQLDPAVLAAHSE